MYSEREECNPSSSLARSTCTRRAVRMGRTDCYVLKTHQRGLRGQQIYDVPPKARVRVAAFSAAFAPIASFGGAAAARAAEAAALAMSSSTSASQPSQPSTAGPSSRLPTSPELLAHT